MNKFIKTIIMTLFVVLAFTQSVNAMCYMAQPQDARECYQDSEGVCCVIVTENCVEAMCYNFDTCEPYTLIRKSCRDQSDP
jgi:hypothetical protein